MRLRIPAIGRIIVSRSSRRAAARKKTSRGDASGYSRRTPSSCNRITNSVAATTAASFSPGVIRRCNSNPGGERAGVSVGGGREGVHGEHC